MSNGPSANRPSGNVDFDNQDRVVVVTGGSRGIGHSICIEFRRSGAHVICVDVNPPPQEAIDAGIVFRQTDVSSESQCQATIQSIIDEFGTVDVLVNNAAIQPLASYVPLDEMPGELWEKVMSINVSGYTYMAKFVIPAMKAQRSGVIVNMASAQALRTAREVGAYGPSKAANLLQAKQWAVEFARFGIRVVSVSPGAINTPLVRASLENQGGEAELANRHPLGRIGEPHEIAHAVLWLASSGASFVTATNLSVDGGLDGYGAFADPYPIDSVTLSKKPDSEN